MTVQKISVSLAVTSYEVTAGNTSIPIFISTQNSGQVCLSSEWNFLLFTSFEEAEEALLNYPVRVLHALHSHLN